jgi:hypothetical protein
MGPSAASRSGGLRVGGGEAGGEEQRVPLTGREVDRPDQPHDQAGPRRGVSLLDEVPARAASSNWLIRRAVRQRRNSVGNRDMTMIFTFVGPRCDSLAGIAVSVSRGLPGAGQAT